MQGYGTALADHMFDKLRNVFAVIGIILTLFVGGYYALQTYQQARAGAAVYVWLNSKPAADQPPRIQTLEALINPQK
jgi:hypothetical protein